MTASIFGDFGVDFENVDDDPNSVPDATYPAFLTESKIVNHKDGSTKSWVTVYKISEDAQKGKTVEDWKQVVGERAAADASRIKQRLLSLGVPRTALNSIAHEDLIGTAVMITTKKNGQYTNLVNVRLPEGDAIAGLDANFGTQTTVSSGLPDF